MNKTKGQLPWHIVMVASVILLASTAQAQAQGFSANVISQIEAINTEKTARTPAQQKIDSQLLQAARAVMGFPPPFGVPSMQSSIDFDASGNTLVDIKAKVTAAVLSQIQKLGGSVVSAH